MILLPQSPECWDYKSDQPHGKVVLSVLEVILWEKGEKAISRKYLKEMPC
jgi:hypothetical protein